MAHWNDAAWKWDAATSWNAASVASLLAMASLTASSSPRLGAVRSVQASASVRPTVGAQLGTTTNVHLTRWNDSTWKWNSSTPWDAVQITTLQTAPAWATVTSSPRLGAKRGLQTSASLRPTFGAALGGGTGVRLTVWNDSTWKWSSATPWDASAVRMAHWNDSAWTWNGPTPWDAPATRPSGAVNLQASGASRVVSSPALGALRSLQASGGSTVTASAQPGLYQSLLATGGSTVTGTAPLTGIRGLLCAGYLSVTADAELSTVAPSNLPGATTFAFFYPSTPTMSFRLSSLQTSGSLQASGASRVTGTAGLGGQRSLVLASSVGITAAVPIGAVRSLRANGFAHAAGTGNLSYFTPALGGFQTHATLTLTANAALRARRALQASNTLHPVAATMAFTGSGSTAAAFNASGVSSVTFNPS